MPEKDAPGPSVYRVSPSHRPQGKATLGPGHSPCPGPPCGQRPPPPTFAMWSLGATDLENSWGGTVIRETRPPRTWPVPSLASGVLDPLAVGRGPCSPRADPLPQGPAAAQVRRASLSGHKHPGDPGRLRPRQAPGGYREGGHRSMTPVGRGLDGCASSQSSDV